MGPADEWKAAPLGGCDCYLLALEDYMLRAGQGRHVGVTRLELGAGFSPETLRSAATVFAENQPLLGARLKRGLPGCVPAWVPGNTAEVAVVVHPPGTVAEVLTLDLLQGRWEGRLRFDILPAGAKTVVLMSWSHLLFDARGVELALAEVARLGGEAAAKPERNSWALPLPSKGSLWRGVRGVQPFLDRYWELRSHRVVAPGPAPAAASPARFRVVHFDAGQTARMKTRAEHLTGGIFALPYFLAVTMRAHAAIPAVRGGGDSSLECAIAVQGRKRGAHGPIFQNHVSQMFFSLPVSAVGDLDGATRALHAQFHGMTRSGCDRAFVTMINWMRRLPPRLYRRFLEREADGQIASFYHAHTGEFLPGVRSFCGAEILDGWHVPSVSQPPGTGLFFSERAGRLTASLCWRGDVISPESEAAVWKSVRGDLLGADE